MSDHEGSGPDDDVDDADLDDADLDADEREDADAVATAEPVLDTAMAGADERPHLSRVERQATPYTESQVIMATVKVVSPFVFTYGLFITFHGGGSPGGGFQGGAIMAAVVFMIAFAFGIDATRQWLANAAVVALAVGGTLAFAGIGLATMALGGAFLQYELLPIPKPVTYGMEGVEILGIAAIVSGVLMGLFFLLAVGFDRGDGAAVTDGGRDRDGGHDRDGDRSADAADAADAADHAAAGGDGEGGAAHATATDHGGNR
ncbi:cation:proton antiporter [Halorubrum sp. JWXQ-INN 858]|uniref:MnhB domain-containing protein n=1 Tax=Halorubrum sp. JWXQ-INN 858 TaxID=2690782 RepID=UPI001356E817|nr:MnhB domain-containing protein [Halorubrum sp. JWXQ-INN 858]MWV64455.1 cation:proton antiporter [Halorubrum sp. JWXQ-INN 858]